MPKATSQTLDAPSSAGGFVVRETVRFAFFMRHPHREVAHVAVRAVEKMIDLLPPPALSMFAVESGDWIEFDASGMKMQIRERLDGDDKPINATAALSGDQANIPDVTLDYAGLALDRPVFRDAASMLTVDIAASFFGTVLERSIELGGKLADELDCHAAYIDLALVGDQSRKQAMARRYRCMDISDPRCVARDLGDRLPGVFWKNFIGVSLVEALGGRQAIEAVLSPEARIEPKSRGGLVLTFGPTPIRGDINYKETFDDRIALARLARDKGVLHVPRKIVYFEAEQSFDDSEAQENWHLRYATV